MARPAVCEKRSFPATCALLVMSRLPENAGLTLGLAGRSYALMPSSRSRGSEPGKSFRSRPFFTCARVLGAVFLHYNYDFVAMRV